jgi:hypothetical protein
VQIRSRHGLPRLSLTNQLPIALAHPSATFVAGFKGWLRLGYCVTRGQTAIHINAPMPVKRRDRYSDEATEEIITLFKTVPVFAQDQVAPLYNQLQQRARREHGEAFDRPVRSARERLYGADPDDEKAAEERSIRTRIRTRERKKTFEDVVDEWRDQEERP